MTKLAARGYTDGSGKRTTLRLDEPTWSAIDHIAALKGFNWAQWVHSVPVQFDNRHTDIRTAVVDSLMNIKSPQIQPEIYRLDAPLLTDAQTMTDSEFAADLSDNMTIVDDAGAMNFGGFTLRTGTRQGTQCVWIENNLRNAPNIVIPIPAWVKQIAVVNAAMQQGDAA